MNIVFVTQAGGKIFAIRTTVVSPVPPAVVAFIRQMSPSLYSYPEIASFQEQRKATRLPSGDQDGAKASPVNVAGVNTTPGPAGIFALKSLYLPVASTLL